MMCALLLFGLKLAPLYKAIAMVESKRGFTSRNVYQIRSIYVEDVNRLYDLKGRMAYHARDVYDIDKSEMMMWLYWKHYAYEYARETKQPVTFEILAKMHNRGGLYWKQGKQTQMYADKYWAKVKREL